MSLKLEVGKTYLDGYGRTVRILCLDSGGYQPCVGLVNSTTAEYYSLDGTDKRKTYYDPKTTLVSEYKGPVYNWTNIYKRSASTGVITATYDSEKLAQKGSTDWTHGELLGRLKINVETGEAVNIPL